MSSIDTRSTQSKVSPRGSPSRTRHVRFARIPDSWMERYADLDAWQRTPKPPVFDLSARRADLIH
ncbi:MAG: hypothetical protein INH05_00630 [Burkholderiales bacterium]|nr:hypothetical protein [Burkholderiales bacterium]